MSRAKDQDLQESILKILEKVARPMAIGKLTALLKLPSHATRTVRRLVKDLVSQGKVLSEGRGKYSLGRPACEISGKLGNPRGRFFPVMSGDGTVLMRIHPQQLNGALPGDMVAAEAICGPGAKGRTADKGRVVAVKSPGARIVVGVLQRQAKACFVISDDENFSRAVMVRNQEDCLNNEGQVVALRVSIPDSTGKLFGDVFRILGPEGEFGTELERLCVQHGLERDFPGEVMDELHARIVDAEKDSREDLRAIPHVTIDPKTAKDFDDAVFVEPHGQGWRLWVSIADVSAFVQMDSATDQEALRKGCSTYLPGTVFPMLPGVLSEDVCSLAPGRDKAAITVQMDISTDGIVLDAKVQRTLIRSAARLSYEQVQRVLDGEAADGIAEQQELIGRMADCASALLGRMRERGQILFDIPELRFALDGKGLVKDAGPIPHGLANRMIEAFMVAANETVGRIMKNLQVPALYRIHEQPDFEKMREFILTAGALGCKPDFGQLPSPAQLSSFLGEIENKPVGPALSQLLLKSLMQAKYSTDPKEHFGLATESYLHFTSPIRRYPDLVIHRQLTELLKNPGRDGLQLHSEKLPFTKWPVEMSRAQELADLCSKSERRSLAAERAAASLYQAAWALERVGEEFDAIVSYASDLGLFVQLRPSMVEGLIHISRLGGDYYDYDPEKLALVGRRSGKIFRIGQPLRVNIRSSNLARRRVDLDLA